MTQSLPIAILLYIAAFLLGFFLLYLWRAKLSSRAYTQEISDLKQTLAEQQKRRTGAEEKHFHTESHHAKVHQELEEKEATQSALQAHEAALMERITELENEKERLEEKIREEESETLKVRSEIKKLSEERDAVNKEQARVDENAETLSRLDEKLSDLKSLTESYLREIEALDALREKFHEEASLLEEKISGAKALLHKTGEEIAAVERKFAPTLAKLAGERDALKIKALNYKFALKEYLEHYGEQPLRIKEPLIQKLFRMPKNKAEEIESLITRSEAPGALQAVKQKLFKNKSTKEEH